jgi:hypothetical protein
MKKFNLLTLVSLLAVLVVFVFGVSVSVADDVLYKRVPQKEHVKAFPDGHGPGAGCYYDDEEHVYFCSFMAEEEKAAKKAGGKTEVVYQRIEGAEYRGLHPETKGREAAVSGCYYEEAADEYFCAYEAEEQLIETKGQVRHIAGAPVYKMVPKAEHQKAFPEGHDKGVPCFYDEEEAVYFCAHAD